MMKIFTHHIVSIVTCRRLMIAAIRSTADAHYLSKTTVPTTLELMRIRYLTMYKNPNTIIRS